MFKRRVSVAGRQLSAGLVVATLALAGCRKEEVAVYQTPKEQPRAADPLATPHGGQAIPQIQWQKPADWQEQPTSGMRYAGFVVPGEGGEQVTVAVVPLAGVTGKELDIVNIFREGAQWGPMTEADLAQVTEKVPFGALQGKLFDLASPEGSPVRLLVAVLDQDTGSWYFRFSGPAALVAKRKPEFLAFLNSVKLGEPTAASLPAGHPAVSAGAAVPRGQVPLPSGPASDKPEWTVPVGWKEVPPTQMILARFQVAADDGKAEITISSFPGEVGGLVANVNRWRGQIGLAPADQAEVDKLVAPLDLPGGKAMLVDMTGQKDNHRIRLVGVIVPRAGKTWFYKLLGDDVVAGREKEVLTRFLQSVRYP
jgi:hypothetical protein